MEVKKDVKQWRQEVDLVLDSKRTEFLMMGYSKTTNDDIWKCLLDKVWKDGQKKHLYEIVQDIFHLSPSVYMNYLTLSTYQDDDLMKSIAAVTKE